MMITLLLLLCQEDPFQEFRNLRALSRGKAAQAASFRLQAHLALDRGDYDSSVTLSRVAKTLQGEAVRLRARQEAILEAVVNSVVSDLDSPDIDFRDRASRRLIELGPEALAHIEKALETAVRKKNDEVMHRLQDVLESLRAMTLDDAGRLRQWAATARASSEYTDSDWSAKQAAGPPDTNTAGDAKTAWATREADGGEEWIELTYDRWVQPSHVRIHETFNPGAVVKVEALDAVDRWIVLWQGRDTTTECPGWLTLGVSGKIQTRTIRITIDTSVVTGWNEIDAVELIGEAVAPPKGK